MTTQTLKYIIKRIALAMLTLWIVITVTFFVMHAVPGGPFQSEKALSPEAQAALEEKYGLDRPVLVQYGNYLKNIVTRLDFGPSLTQTGRNVTDIIADGMRVSAKLGLLAAGIALVLGVVLGSVAALQRNALADKLIMVFTTACISMPSFIMGTFLLLLFARVRVVFLFRDAPCAYVRFLFIKIPLYPKKKKKVRPSDYTYEKHRRRLERQRKKEH